MTYNNWVYIAVMAAVSYAIRVLPLTLIRKPIKNQFIQSFLYYVPYVTLAVMTFPAIINATQSPIAGAAALVVGIAAAWFGASLFQVSVSCCAVVLVFGALSFLPLWFWVGHGGFLVFENFFGKLVTFRRFCRLMGEPVPKHTKKEGCAHGAPQF